MDTEAETGKSVPVTAWTCPDCGETSPVSEWRECEVRCDDCGSHDGRECPQCGERFDLVYTDLDETAP